MKLSLSPNSDLSLSITPFNIFVCLLSRSSISSSLRRSSSQLYLISLASMSKPSLVLSSVFFSSLFYLRAQLSWSYSYSSFSVLVLEFRDDLVRLWVWAGGFKRHSLYSMMDSVILWLSLSIFLLPSSMSLMASLMSTVLTFKGEEYSEPSVTHCEYLSRGSCSLNTLSSPSILYPSKYQQALRSSSQFLLISSNYFLNCLMASMWYQSGGCRMECQQVTGLWNQVWQKLYLLITLPCSNAKC